MNTEALLVLAVALGVGFAIYFYSRPRVRVLDAPTLRKELLDLTHDADAAERLIASERRRDPDATELQLLRKVVNRLKHERRR